MDVLNAPQVVTPPGLGMDLSAFAGPAHAGAKIEGDKLIVWSDKVEKPVAVRFGWANYPVVNLWNKADLPASPFRTDDFSAPGSARRSASAR